MKNIPITTRGLFLILSLLLGTALLLQTIDFQAVLSTGDHGLMLYASEANLRGQQPFHDYHYFYGPLMTYYYSAFLKMFGNAIISVLIGKKFLVLVSGLLVYGILSLFLSPFFSFIGSFWFWIFNEEFYYTYNHVGITLASLAILYCVLHYYKERNLRYLYAALIGCVVAGLIKLNFGGSLLACVVLCALLIDMSHKQTLNKRFYLVALILTPAAILLSNAAFVIGLPFSVIKQCYQYFGNDVVAEHYPSLWRNLGQLAQIIYNRTVASWYSEFILVIIAIVGMANIYLVKKGRLTDFGTKRLAMVAAIVGIFFILNLHEFLISGVKFRSNYSFPVLIVFLFLVIGLYARHVPPVIRSAILTVVFCVLALQVRYGLRVVDAFRTSAHHLAFDKARIYIGNSGGWTQAVTQSILYLNENLKEDELFLALPYEPLYYYLTDRKSPTRMLAAFKFLNITKEQDEGFIRAIEENHINFVLLSNRVITTEVGLGVMGADYCPLLLAYLEKNFEVVANFGEWTPRPSWADHHGIRILKRKD